MENWDGCCPDMEKVALSVLFSYHVMYDKAGACSGLVSRVI